MTKDTTYPSPNKVIEREVILVLSRVLDKEEDSQLYGYGDTKYSDAVIAEEMNTHFGNVDGEITSSRVQGIRQRFYGKFPPKLSTEERLAKAEADLAAALDEIAKLKSSHKQVDSLSVNDLFNGKSSS